VRAGGDDQKDVFRGQAQPFQSRQQRRQQDVVRDRASLIIDGDGSGFRTTVRLERNRPHRMIQGLLHQRQRMRRAGPIRRGDHIDIRV
jgi:hypothetical protein